MVVKRLFEELPRDRYSRIFVRQCIQLFGDHIRKHGIISYKSINITVNFRILGKKNLSSSLFRLVYY